MANYMLVSFKTCPWVQRSAIALREKNAPFEFRHIESDNRPDWFLAISPHKKVPVLQRYVYHRRIKKIGSMEIHPRLKPSGEALMKRPSTHSFPEAEFEAMYREGLRKRGSYLSQFVEAPRAAAE